MRVFRLALLTLSLFVGLTALSVTADRSSDASAAVKTVAHVKKQHPVARQGGPRVPKRVAVTAATETDVSISWKAPRGARKAVRYTVLRNGVRVRQTRRTSARLRGFTCGTSYLVRVVALDAADRRSTASKSIPVATPCPPPARAAAAAAAAVPAPPNAGAQLMSLFASDMTGVSEAVPGFPNIPWAQHPEKRSFPPPADFSALTAWGVMDNVGGVNQAGSVQIGSIEQWIKSRRTGTWTRVMYDAGVVGGAFFNSDFLDGSQPAGQSGAAGGGTAVMSPPSGYNFHFWPGNGRASMNAGDVAGVVSIIRARLLPGSFNAANPPKFVLCSALDWWRSTSAPRLADYSNNFDGGIGKFKRVDANMRMFTMSNGDLSGFPALPYDQSEMR